ncbi:hypothetical protein, partial [Conyzicola sp.]|uniref:hypothetical protein n=1 Tax=Conyzicola sp. TaxID=1969404 RepID=UPI00398A41BC
TEQGDTHMRKFIFNGSIISAIFGAVGVLQTTRKGPRDWRLILMWISWAATLAIAVGTVIDQANDSNELED